MHAAEPLPHFVDDYLSFLYEVHPTGATMDGVHVHDDLIEDYRRSAIDTHVSALAGFGRRLDGIPVDALPTLEQIEHQIVASNIRARQFELEAVRPGSGTRTSTPTPSRRASPRRRSSTYAPETDRARRILSKLRQVPRLVQAARDNIKEPPAIFVKVGIDTWRGAMAFIDADLPRAFRELDDLHLLGDLADAAGGGAVDRRLRRGSRDRDPPEGKGSFRLGRDRFEQKLRLEEGITLPVDRLLAIADARAARDPGRIPPGRRPLNGGDPIDRVAQAKQETHPRAGSLIETAREQLGELQTFLVAAPSCRCPTTAASRSRHPGVLPLVVCQHVDAGPVRIASRRAPCIT